jgi:predicted Zn-dependent protease
MRKLLLAVAVFQMSASAQAAQYGHYRIEQIFGTSTQNHASSTDLDLPELNRMLADLNSHAGTVPIQFDNADDKGRARSDTQQLSSRLDQLIRGTAPSAQLLQSAATVNAIGRNLQIPGSAERADTAFVSLLRQTPNSPRANYLYGKFLLQENRPKEAISLLEKSKSLGVTYADYPLGLSYMVVGDRGRALENLQHYATRFPSDATVRQIIEHLRTDRDFLNPGLTSPQ